MVVRVPCLSGEKMDTKKRKDESYSLDSCLCTISLSLHLSPRLFLAFIHLTDLLLNIFTHTTMLVEVLVLYVEDDLTFFLLRLLASVGICSKS